MSNENEFVARFMAFKGDDEIVETNVFVELTDMTQDGRVELAFNDRGERCYLKFSLVELIREIGRQNGSKP